MSDTPKTVWVTKWALEYGIVEVQARNIDDNLIVARMPDGRRKYLINDDWHLTREAAVTRAKSLRDAKLSSLERQAERLRGLEF